MTAPPKPIQLGDSSDILPETPNPNPSLTDGDDDDELNKTPSPSPPPVEKVSRSPAESEESFDFDHEVPFDKVSDVSSSHTNVAEGESTVSGPNEVPSTKKNPVEPKLISNLKDQDGLCVAPSTP